MEDFKYSIDKIKLVISGYETSFLQELGNNLLTNSRWNTSIVPQYESNKVSKCYNSFVLEHIDGNLYIGFCPNWIKSPSERERCICLEYNPNKVAIDDFPILNRLLLQSGIKIKVLSVDVAVDILGVHINDIIFNKWHGSVKEIEYRSSVRETQYFGEIGHNHIKVYDKAKEQKVKDLNWTRFEITLKDLGYYGHLRVDKFSIPTMYLVGSEQLNMFDGFNALSDKDKYYLMNYIHYPDGIKYLDSRTRKKVLELAATNLKTIEIDKTSILNTIYEYKIA